MLRSLIICPDSGLNQPFQQLLAELGFKNGIRNLDYYPDSLELFRYLRADAPEVVFVSVESMSRAIEIAGEVEKNSPGVQVVAVGRPCDPQILVELMRAGIREYASLPFDRRDIHALLDRIARAIEAKPPSMKCTDDLFAFLPSKAGAGTSTIALNASIALSRLADTHVLLSDFDLNCGMLLFMLKLENGHGAMEAAEHAFGMDEGLWRQMVKPVDKLDVLHGGKLNPDFRIEPAQMRRLIAFMRRNYDALCFDLSGNLEKYSVEIMHAAKKIFLVCTPEIPSLHLAREKYVYLKDLNLQDRVCVLLNRCEKRPIITPEQIEELLGLPIMLTFPNDYQGVHRALTFGRRVEPASDLGKQFALLAQNMLNPPQRNAPHQKKRFIDYFPVMAGRYGVAEKKTG